MSSEKQFYYLSETANNEHFTIFTSGRCLLSNFALTPFRFNGSRFRTLQHAYEVEKAKFFGDAEAVDLIKRDFSPREATLIAQTISNYDADAWDEQKVSKMLTLLRHKFRCSLSAKRVLLSTGSSVIVFAFKGDLFWGNGLSEDDVGNLQTDAWLGQNKLGYLLMQVRSELMEETHNRS